MFPKMRKKFWFLTLGLACCLGYSVEAKAQGKSVRVLIIDGQNNHNWKATTPIMKKALEDAQFQVDVATAPGNPGGTPKKPKDNDDPAAKAKYEKELADYQKSLAVYKAAMAKFHPDLTKYDVVVSNYNGDTWSKELQDDLEKSLKSGKIGLVIVHAANNSFGNWVEYNLMIGMGWRGNNYGKRLKLDDQGKQILVPKGQDEGSGHRYSGPFQLVIRDSNHPITKGMPQEWMHYNDELYDNMRGPIEHVHLLGTAYSKGTKTHEPMIWTVSYGEGRVFHTPMGHDVGAMQCVGFITTLQRGTEWAATGKVTIPIPQNFPTAAKTSTIKTK